MDWRRGRTLLVKFLLCFGLLNAQDLPPPCDNEIYCISRPDSLLHVVQMARLYKDSKTFVDKPVKSSPEVVLDNFETLMKQTGSSPSKEQVKQFVDANFDPEGSEFQHWDPADWHSQIKLFDQLEDDKYRAFAKYLHRRWKDLGRQIKNDVKTNPDKYSIIYLSHPFIVPGGRFREMYYWDSYWTIQGLLVSEMYETVRGMLQNFVQLIQTVGLIPNGNRIYYTRRTQPPLFISMVDAYYEATNDKTFIQANIDFLDQEFNYWMVNRTKTFRDLNGKEHQLARYNVQVDNPRPESYFEDYRDAQKLQGDANQKEFYQNMKSGAESGWDYSTRWFIKDDGTPSEDLLDIKTRHIIPVDLNSYLCRNAQILAKFHEMLGHQSEAQKYNRLFDKFADSIDEVLWNQDKGAWFDYKLDHQEQNTQFYPSNLAPLWAKCYHQSKLKDRIIPVIHYVESMKAFDYPGGVPTSMVKSGQQWDFSNAWPPLQEILITGLNNSGQTKAQELAKGLANKWMQNVYVSYVQSGQKMFEKYDVEQVGLPGGGGEYEVQEGFGWSNGVVLHLMQKYQHLVSPDVNRNSASEIKLSIFVPCVIAVIVRAIVV